MPLRPARQPRAYLGAALTLVVVVAIGAALALGAHDGRHVAVSVPAEPAPASGAAAATIRLPAKRDLRILYVGDSLRGSVFASAPDKGYVGLVNAAIDARGHAVTELDATKVGRTPGKSRGANDILGVQGGADLAVLEIGTNDVNHLSIPRFTSAYRALVHMVRRTSPDAQLMCLGVWSLPTGPATLLAPYNAVIAQECRGGVYFPLTDIFRNPRLHGPAGRRTWDGTGDAFHPNDAGYRAIAARVLSHLSF